MDHYRPDVVTDPVLGIYRSEPEPVTLEAAPVYLPAQRLVRPDEPVPVEVRALPDGTRALLAYSSLKQLIACCGEHQPWAQVRGRDVHEHQRDCDADVILWDHALPSELQRTKESLDG
ncbi:SAV_915 family protein [Amycolatopsis sp. NBC_00438]|uniref:SAV_915 family protein n=1 Tax=Amycolatopsis sp. NBC_00438 TaxID=2903558 RepID=UPI002E1B1A0D